LNNQIVGLLGILKSATMLMGCWVRRRTGPKL